MTEWAKHGDDTYTAKAGDFTLRVWKQRQYQTFGWTLTKGHIVKAGDSATLEEAQKAAEDAVEVLGER